MLEIWYNDFKNTPKEEFNQAIQNIRYTSKFFPSVADIKEQIAKCKTKDISSAEEEWQNVLNAVRYYGSYREQEALQSLSPYTSKIVSYVGYQRICTSTSDEQVWNKKEFIEEYNSLLDKNILELQTSTKQVLLNE